MVKNIIFDIGGVMFDDSTQNISNIFNEDSKQLCRKVFGDAFKDCVLGNLEVDDYIESFKDDIDYEKIKFILGIDGLNVSFPLMIDNYNYISSLKDKGYNLYILSNISKLSYEYISNIIDINNTFSGGIYSFKEHLIKPDKKIYELIIDRYNLDKNDTIFFDDKQKNIDAACDCGLKGYLFRSIDDIKNILDNN